MTNNRIRSSAFPAMGLRTEVALSSIRNPTKKLTRTTSTTWSLHITKVTSVLIGVFVAVIGSSVVAYSPSKSLIGEQRLSIGQRKTHRVVPYYDSNAPTSDHGTFLAKRINTMMLMSSSSSSFEDAGSSTSDASITNNENDLVSFFTTPPTSSHSEQEVAKKKPLQTTATAKGNDEDDENALISFKLVQPMVPLSCALGAGLGTFVASTFVFGNPFSVTAVLVPAASYMALTKGAVGDAFRAIGTFSYNVASSIVDIVWNDLKVQERIPNVVNGVVRSFDEWQVRQRNSDTDRIQQEKRQQNQIELQARFEVARRVEAQRKEAETNGGRDDDEGDSRKRQQEAQQELERSRKELQAMLGESTSISGQQKGEDSEIRGRLEEEETKQLLLDGPQQQRQQEDDEVEERKLQEKMIAKQKEQILERALASAAVDVVDAERNRLVQAWNERERILAEEERLYKLMFEQELEAEREKDAMANSIPANDDDSSKPVPVALNESKVDEKQEKVASVENSIDSSIITDAVGAPAKEDVTAKEAIAPFTKTDTSDESKVDEKLEIASSVEDSTDSSVITDVVGAGEKEDVTAKEASAPFTNTDMSGESKVDEKLEIASSVEDSIDSSVITEVVDAEEKEDVTVKEASAPFTNSGMSDDVEDINKLAEAWNKKERIQEERERKYKLIFQQEMQAERSKGIDATGVSPSSMDAHGDRVQSDGKSTKKKSKNVKEQAPAVGFASQSMKQMMNPSRKK